MLRILSPLLLVLFCVFAAHAQLENPRFGGSPFAKGATLMDVPENAKVYISVKSARGDKTIEAMIEKIKKETSWTVVENPDDANVAIETAQTRNKVGGKNTECRSMFEKEMPRHWSGRTFVLMRWERPQERN